MTHFFNMAHPDIPKITRVSRFIPAVLVLAACAVLSCGQGNKPAQTTVAAKQYTRIVSMAPNITETLFALGLGDRVAGVTDFCKYPPEALTRPKTGGLFNPNYEAVVSLKPDLIILLPEQEETRKYLSGLGIETLTVHNRVVAEILDTITAVGNACGAQEKAAGLRKEIESRMAAIREKTAGRGRPRVLMVVERTMGAGSPGAVYVTGPETFYDELITIAGGTNAYIGHSIAYPQISGEGILKLDPEIIIDLLPVMRVRGIDEKTLRRDWNSLPGVSAVKTGRLYTMSADYTAVPGPRFILILEDLARIIHPEQFGEPGKR